MKINFKPWGWYKDLYEGPGYKLKVISIDEGHQLSLQSHQYRSEVWNTVSGQGEFFVSGIWSLARVGNCIKVPINTIHRAKAGTGGLIFVEIQFGEKLSEDDIQRLEDDYGRVVSSE
tara:strand:- start:356 stop:706 length:351 start_codon:yes stop_codon:yes gene_type:complete